MLNRQLYSEAIVLACVLVSLTGCVPPAGTSRTGRAADTKTIGELLKAADTKTIRELLNNAESGDCIRVPAGLFYGDISVPPGVSLQGVNARETVIVGAVTLAAFDGSPISLSDVTLIHAGPRFESLVNCKGDRVVIKHCVLVSEGGFATVNGVLANSVSIHNNLIVGPVGDYAIFGRGRCKLEIVNNTILVQGFGVGLMDGSYAKIRNCLFCGDDMPTVIRTNADYEISYCNISPGRGSFYYNHSLIDGSIHLRDSANHPNDATPPTLSNKDEPKYDSIGLTFHSHRYSTSRDIDLQKKETPAFATHAGSPAREDRNPDGTRNTLGAFGGPLGDW